MITKNDAKYSRSIRAVLGSCVSVTVDRTYNKLYLGKRDGINCGRITTPGQFYDAEAYVLGIDEPISSGDFEITGIIKRKAMPNAYVLAKPGEKFYEPYVAYMLENFISRESHYICYHEKSCGAVLFTYKNGTRHYILIKNMSGHVGFPKGHIEFGEDEEAAALREIYEETGVHTQLIDGFRKSYDYIINGCVKKEAVYFTAPFEEKNVKMKIMEISEYMIVTYEEGMAVLNYVHDRDILTAADEFITAIGK